MECLVVMLSQEDAWVVAVLRCLLDPETRVGHQEKPHADTAIDARTFNDAANWKQAGVRAVL